METNTRLQFFANELNDINDQKLRSFAIKLLTEAPDYFFTVPASSSGKYHPYFAREENGLVKHTRCVVFFAECNAESFNFDSHMKDMLIIAAIAHDIKKQGNNNYGRHTVWEHPELAHDYILEMQNKYPDLISIENATIIAEAVLSHMGKWSYLPEYTRGKKAYPLPTSLFDYALQSADYMASRTEITGFNFRPTDGIVISGCVPLNEENTTTTIEPTSPPILSDIGDTVISFGKHKGKTIREIVAKHPDYIDWMLNKSDFNNNDIRDKVKAYLQTKN